MFRILANLPLYLNIVTHEASWTYLHMLHTYLAPLANTSYTADKNETPEMCITQIPEIMQRLEHLPKSIGWRGAAETNMTLLQTFLLTPYTPDEYTVTDLNTALTYLRTRNPQMKELSFMLGNFGFDQAVDAILRATPGIYIVETRYKGIFRGKMYHSVPVGLGVTGTDENIQELCYFIDKQVEHNGSAHFNIRIVDDKTNKKRYIEFQVSNI